MTTMPGTREAIIAIARATITDVDAGVVEPRAFRIYCSRTGRLTEQEGAALIMRNLAATMAEIVYRGEDVRPMADLFISPDIGAERRRMAEATLRAYGVPMHAETVH